MFKRMAAFAVACACVLGISGCSAETQQETNEALQETGDAIDSAVEDAAEATEGAVEGASEAVEENQAEPAEVPE